MKFSYLVAIIFLTACGKGGDTAAAQDSGATATSGGTDGGTTGGTDGGTDGGTTGGTDGGTDGGTTGGTDGGTTGGTDGGTTGGTDGGGTDGGTTAPPGDSYVGDFTADVEEQLSGGTDTCIGTIQISVFDPGLSGEFECEFQGVFSSFGIIRGKLSGDVNTADNTALGLISSNPFFGEWSGSYFPGESVDGTMHGELDEGAKGYLVYDLLFETVPPKEK